jgi:hypothetical protein
MFTRPGRACSIVILLGVVGGPARVAAQDVTAAAKAFSAGQQAELAREWGRAAEFYELADRISPSPQALRSAAKNHLAAGDQAAAATQAEELLRRYADDSASTSLGTGILQQTAPHLSRWDVSCTPACTLAVDSAAVFTEPRVTHIVYVDPGDHRLEAFFPGNRSTTTTISSAEGMKKEISFEPPAHQAPSKGAAEIGGDATAGADQGRAPGADEGTTRGGLPPAITLVGLGLTGVLGAITLWSGLDTMDARDAYERQPSQSGYDDGIDRQRRTNILIGATSVAGAATLGIALFATRWTSSPDKEAPAASIPAFTFAATPTDAQLFIRGRF